MFGWFTNDTSEFNDSTSMSPKSDSSTSASSQNQNLRNRNSATSRKSRNSDTSSTGSEKTPGPMNRSSITNSRNSDSNSKLNDGNASKADSDDKRLRSSYFERIAEQELNDMASLSFLEQTKRQKWVKFLKKTNVLSIMWLTVVYLGLGCGTMHFGGEMDMRRKSECSPFPFLLSLLLFFLSYSCPAMNWHVPLPGTDSKLYEATHKIGRIIYLTRHAFWIQIIHFFIGTFLGGELWLWVNGNDSLSKGVVLSKSEYSSIKNNGNSFSLFTNTSGSYSYTGFNIPILDTLLLNTHIIYDNLLHLNYPWFLQQLFEINARMTILVSALSTLVSILFMLLVYPDKEFLAESAMYQTKYGINYYAINIVCHLIGFPVALIDTFLLKGTYLSDIRISSFLGNIFLLLIFDIYYILLLQFNTRIMGASYPYGVLKIIDSKGLVAWLLFLSAIVVFAGILMGMFTYLPIWETGMMEMGLN